MKIKQLLGLILLWCIDECYGQGITIVNNCTCKTFDGGIYSLMPLRRTDGKPRYTRLSVQSTVHKIIFAINWVDNVYFGHRKEFLKLTPRALAFVIRSEVKNPNISFRNSLRWPKYTWLTQLIKPDYFVILKLMITCLYQVDIWPRIFSVLPMYLRDNSYLLSVLTFRKDYVTQTVSLNVFKTGFWLLARNILVGDTRTILVRL